MRIQKLLVLVITLIFGISGSGLAGSVEEQRDSPGTNGQGYVFFAPGTLVIDRRTESTAHMGGGGEFLFYRGAGIGIELGYLTPWRDWNVGIGMLSIGGAYHFNKDRKVVPFVTAGYSLGIRDGHVNLFNYGGGVNYWFREKIGLRLEFRDHAESHRHFMGARIGLSFR